MKIYKIKELQLGIIITIITFVLLYFSKADVNMTFTHGLIITITAILLGVLMLNLLTILKVPHVGQLHILYKHDDYFFNVYKQLFFYIYYTLFTIMVGLLAEVLGNDRAQNIFLISTFVTSIYYVIISIWCTYRFVYKASIEENLQFEGIEEI